MMLEEQKRNRRTPSDYAGCNSDRNIKTKKIVFDHNPFCFQSVILSKKLETKQENEMPISLAFPKDAAKKYCSSETNSQRSYPHGTIENRQMP